MILLMSCIERAVLHFLLIGALGSLSQPGRSVKLSRIRSAARITSLPLPLCPSTHNRCSEPSACVVAHEPPAQSEVAVYGGATHRRAGPPCRFRLSPRTRVVLVGALILSAFCNGNACDTISLRTLRLL